MKEARIKLKKYLIRFSNQSRIRNRIRRAKDKRVYYFYRAANSFYDIKEREY
jgi:hypothetical protein